MQSDGTLSHKIDRLLCMWFQGHFMFMSNLEEYGHLVNPDDYSTGHLHNDLYEIDSNKLVSECTVYIQY